MPGQTGDMLRHEAQVQMNAHLPVTALPQMSLPVRAKGMHAACIKHIKSHDFVIYTLNSQDNSQPGSRQYKLLMYGMSTTTAAAGRDAVCRVALDECTSCSKGSKLVCYI